MDDLRYWRKRADSRGRNRLDAAKKQADSWRGVVWAFGAVYGAFALTSARSTLSKLVESWSTTASVLHVVALGTLAAAVIASSVGSFGVPITSSQRITAAELRHQEQTLASRAERLTQVTLLALSAFLLAALALSLVVSLAPEIAVPASNPDAK